METYMTKEYNRVNVQTYAAKWALARNPLFEDFSLWGGDCTNFASQCILAGSCTMNFTDTFGWYFNSTSDRSPSWTGVEYLYNFLIDNKGVGPFAKLVTAGSLELGDIIQLGGRTGSYYHTLVVTGFNNVTYLVSTHTDDAFDRPLNTYDYYRARMIHILGVREKVNVPDDSFNNLLSGIAIPKSNKT
jgi:hypothetical protein